MFIENPRTTGRIGMIAFGRLIIPVLAVLLFSTIGNAASVAIDPAGINAIFSQPSFGDTPISIRFNPAIEIVAPDLLVIDNLTELQALYALAPDPAPTVDAFFVDQLDACGFVEANVNGAFNGCAQLPGRFMVEDFNAAELYPATLMGHELGHNLNLGHMPLGLMSFFLPHEPPDLFADQVATILQSPLVQTDPTTGERFIQITPIAIVGAPEPSTLLLLSAALGALLSNPLSAQRQSLKNGRQVRVGMAGRLDGIVTRLRL
jgi:hypothetical protein